MPKHASQPDSASLAPAPIAPTLRLIAEGADWQISEHVCRAGPQDRPFEERHALVSIGAVLEGSFQYRGATGSALLYPGAFLLGNARACFECSHEHGTGDRCVSFQYAPQLFEEIASAAAASYRFRFPAAMLPAEQDLTPAAVAAAAIHRGLNQGEAEELAITVAETVLTVVSGRPAAQQGSPSAQDARRISDAIRHIETHAEAPLDLAGLAAVAHMSRYHFLRVFRRVTGLTPYRYVIGLRLRRAGVRLRTSRDSVAAIAFEAGFGDLSTFNNRFRGIFGVPPSVFRKSRR